MNGDVRRGAIRPVLDAKGRLDQLEDRLSGTQEAGGSNPPASTSIGISEDIGRRRDDEGGCAANRHESLLGHDGNDSHPHSDYLLVVLSQSTRYPRPHESDLL